MRPLTKFEHRIVSALSKRPAREHVSIETLAAETGLTQKRIRARGRDLTYTGLVRIIMHRTTSVGGVQTQYFLQLELPAS